MPYEKCVLLTHTANPGEAHKLALTNRKVAIKASKWPKCAASKRKGEVL